MEALIELTKSSKETYFNLQIYSLLDKIDKRCDKWIDGVFINVYVPEEIETRNLLMDLDYIFTEAIWLIEIAESFGYNIDSKQFLESNYNDYVNEGFKRLINPHKYSITEHRLYTEDEIKESNKRMNETTMRILKEMDF